MGGVSAISGIGGLVEAYRASSKMIQSEHDILSQERALKASVPGGSSRTAYKYEIGPDGRRYIVGAEVSIIAPEEELASRPGVKTPAGAAVKPASKEESKSKPVSSENVQQDRETAKLEQTEREVIAHENAHKAAAGRFGGAVHYTYTTGPDGKRYISGGEVPISTPSTKDPKEALDNARQVMRAAMAPGDPSGQDVAVAASAASAEANARAEIARSEGGNGVTAEIARAYRENGSPKGLWSKNYGFEALEDDSSAQNEPRKNRKNISNLDIAA